MLGQTISASEVPVPRMNVNDILAYSSDPEASIVVFGRDGGYSVYGGHWFAIRSPFAMSLREKDELAALPWPGELQSKLDELLRLPAETEWVEFKYNNEDPQEIGEYLSAISNARHCTVNGWDTWCGASKTVLTRF